MSATNARVRDATEADFDAITAIYGFYCQRSAATFEVEPPARDTMYARFAAVKSKRLPYLVVLGEDDAVLGYAYASEFRSERTAYAHSVEISIYIRPECTRAGLGKMLMTRLLEELRDGQHEPPIREVIAVVAEDEVGLGKGVEEFYKYLEFKRVGHLKDVGRKFERYISVSFYQFRLVL
ncbi:acyl-CoA N-acyltransferase [Exidia glandulosa HHB12029]|uniref:Acyl-CoA N-acyltransferase n=1 Tax=Exidia glandulosa HHB12029 TaxID=1314781 RepID=A0A165QYZ6_EXIGL|nr:acyl-CoA N-acyltransferase [Exidia glandulosa HHB12029]